MQRVSAPHIAPHALKLAYLIAFKYMNKETGTARPAQDSLARDLNVSVRTVQRLLDILQPLGLGIAPGDGRGKASTYWIDPVTAKGEERATPMSPFQEKRATSASSFQEKRVTSGARKGRHPVTKKGDTGVAPTLLRRTKEEEPREESDSPPADLFVGKKKEAAEEERKTSANSAPSASGQKEDRGDRRSATDGAGEAFDRFWAAYPRRKAKEAARKAFAKAVENGTAVETLIAGAQRYAVERNGENPKYTKHPATWLNGGCWEDETPGAPVIDEEGNVVAFEREQEARPSSNKSPLEIYEGWLEENPSLRW
jgi:hypothetical protein